VLTHSRRRTAGGRLHFRLRCAPQKTPCHELKKKYEGFWGREHLQMQHMTSDGCRRSSHSHENERPPETSSPEFPHGIGLFPPRKTRPGIKRVGKKHDGESGKIQSDVARSPMLFFSRYLLLSGLSGLDRSTPPLLLFSRLRAGRPRAYVKTFASLASPPPTPPRSPSSSTTRARTGSRLRYLQRSGLLVAATLGIGRFGLELA
jgi:hypothetical protein